MGESSAKNDCARFDFIAVAQGSCKVTGFARHLRDFSRLVDADVPVAFHTADHTADGIFSPLARRYQFGVARDDGSATKNIFFFDNDRLFTHRCDGGCCRQTGWTRTYD
jgi:hypothetical protein